MAEIIIHKKKQTSGIEEKLIYKKRISKRERIELWGKEYF